MKVKIISTLGFALALANCAGDDATSSSSYPTSSSTNIVTSSSTMLPSSSSSTLSISSSSSIVISSSTPSNPTNSLTLEEDSIAICNAAGITESDHAGFSGVGYFNSNNNVGAGITYGIKAIENGSANIEIRYANGGIDTRKAVISVNGGSGGTTDITFNTTGAWSSWQTLNTTVFLNAGQNTITLNSSAEAGLANIDSAKISGNGLSLGNCNGVITASSNASTGNNSSSSVGPVSPPASAKADPSMGGYANTAGYGLSTTTGGSGGKTVSVSNYADLASYALSSEVLTIEVSGTIKAPSGVVMMDVGSNKTIIGKGAGATIDGFGFDINGWLPAQISAFGKTCSPDKKDSFTPTSNVVIRNLIFKNSADDSINIQCYSHHIWVDHNTFYESYDGSVDTKRGSDLVTISYNKFSQTGKTSLVGHSDNNGAQDKGYLSVTYHHNWFDRPNNRTPRVRFGHVHTYNNYYDNNDSCMRIGPGGQIYAEANYVKDAGKILKASENEGSLTWTSSNVWDKNAFGDIGSDKLDANQSVKKPPYNSNVGPAPSSPPPAGAGKI